MCEQPEMKFPDNELLRCNTRRKALSRKKQIWAMQQKVRRKTEQDDFSREMPNEEKALTVWLSWMALREIESKKSELLRVGSNFERKRHFQSVESEVKHEWNRPLRRNSPWWFAGKASSSRAILHPFLPFSQQNTPEAWSSGFFYALFSNARLLYTILTQKKATLWPPAFVPNLEHRKWKTRCSLSATPGFVLIQFRDHCF